MCSSWRQWLKLHSCEEPISGEIYLEGIGCWSSRLRLEFTHERTNRFKEKELLGCESAVGMKLPYCISLTGGSKWAEPLERSGLHPRIGHSRRWGRGIVLAHCCIALESCKGLAIRRERRFSAAVRGCLRRVLASSGCLPPKMVPWKRCGLKLLHVLECIQQLFVCAAFSERC